MWDIIIQIIFLTTIWGTLSECFLAVVLLDSLLSAILSKIDHPITQLHSYSKCHVRLCHPNSCSLRHRRTRPAARQERQRRDGNDEAAEADV